MITEGGKSTVFSDVVTTLDWQATALAVNACGSFAVLAGRKHLGVVDLEKSGDASSLRKIQRQARYDTTAIEWNPHIGMDHQLISTSYQHVDVWNLTAEKPLCKSIKGHTRGISDLNWSLYDSFLFVTCSADTYVYIWDMRETRKPAVAWKAVVLMLVAMFAGSRMLCTCF
ncbi:GATOR2 complex protein WDR59-like [Corticium candelabrum]|uniref:GATOR2 complex protein WDR59-like n=1 Tax=Corticium candelabrum TaxID=121492 RepID=UPI002E27663B|nr:GATOR2 complex protein WDR59-like [Corticium candelabrum]